MKKNAWIDRPDQHVSTLADEKLARVTDDLGGSVVSALLKPALRFRGTAAFEPRDGIEDVA